jgi:hypothetical protein
MREAITLHDKVVTAWWQGIILTKHGQAPIAEILKQGGETIKRDGKTTSECKEHALYVRILRG